MYCVHPACHDFVCVFVGCEFGLAVDDALEFYAGDGFEDCLERHAEGALGHSWDGMFSGAEEVTLREVDGDALRDGVFGFGAEDAVFGLEEVHDDL